MIKILGEIIFELRILLNITLFYSVPKKRLVFENDFQLCLESQWQRQHSDKSKYLNEKIKPKTTIIDRKKIHKTHFTVQGCWQKSLICNKHKRKIRTSYRR